MCDPKPVNLRPAQLINIEKRMCRHWGVLKAKTIPLITLTKAVFVSSTTYLRPPNNLLPKIKPARYILDGISTLPSMQVTINLKQRDDPCFIRFMFYLPISIKRHRSNEKAIHERNSNTLEMKLNFH